MATRPIALISNTRQGDVRKWLDAVALKFSGDECLEFPFARMVSGHGHISERSYGTSLAHVYVALRVLGPKPTPEHECCHDCGNGHLGCVNPKHLYWGTRSDNMQDRVRHGVLVPPPIMRGTSNVNAKLDEKTVRAIRRMISRGIPQVRICGRYSVSAATVSAIYKRRTWAWVE